MTPTYKVRAICSFLWQDEPTGYTVKEVSPGVYAYEYLTLERLASNQGTMGVCDEDH